MLNKVLINKLAHFYFVATNQIIRMAPSFRLKRQF